MWKKSRNLLFYCSRGTCVCDASRNRIFSIVQMKILYTTKLITKGTNRMLFFSVFFFFAFAILWRVIWMCGGDWALHGWMYRYKLKANASSRNEISEDSDPAYILRSQMLSSSSSVSLPLLLLLLLVFLPRNVCACECVVRARVRVSEMERFSVLFWYMERTKRRRHNER